MAKQKKYPEIGDLSAFNTSMHESDRGCLLVCLSETDEKLEELLLLALGVSSQPDAEWLLDQKADNRPLSALAVRARMASCLNLIVTQDRQMIDKMRQLRNNHAHGIMEFKFTEENVDPIAQIYPPIATITAETLLKKKNPKFSSVSRARFILCHIHLMFRLSAKIRELKEQAQVQQNRFCHSN